MQVILPILLLTTTSFLLLVLVFFYKLQKKYIELVKHEERLSRSKRVLRRTRKKANMILDDARQNAQQIIQQTNLKAEEIITKADAFSKEQSNTLYEQIQKYEDQQFNSYREFLEKLKADSINLLNSVSQDITQQTKGDISNLQTHLQQNIAQVDQSISDVITEGVNKISTSISVSQQQAIQVLEQQKNKADQEIEIYKQEKIRQIDEKIFDVISRVTQDFVEKSLNPKEHEEVVYKSLEKAKKDNLFQ
jgi:F0F1-type ATP synthase membrane subunit b/b'